VYLIKTNAYGNFGSTGFSVDGNTAVYLANQSYTWLHLPPGKHKLKATMFLRSAELEIILREGSAHYIYYAEAPSKPPKVTFEEISAEKARKILAFYNYSPAELAP